MQVERYASVNKDQRAEEKRQPMIADTTKCCRQERSRVKDEELHRQSREPENRDDRTKRAGEGTGGGEFVCFKQGQRPKGNDRQNNETAIDPKEPAQKRMKRCEVRPPVEQARRERARDQNHEMQQATDEKECFHSAPIACMNGRITFLTNGGWKSQ